MVVSPQAARFTLALLLGGLRRSAISLAGVTLVCLGHRDGQAIRPQLNCVTRESPARRSAYCRGISCRRSERRSARQHPCRRRVSLGESRMAGRIRGLGAHACTLPLVQAADTINGYRNRMSPRNQGTLQNCEATREIDFLVVGYLILARHQTRTPLVR